MLHSARSRPRRRLAVAVLGALAVLAVSCTSSDDETSTDGDTTTTAAGGAATTDADAPSTTGGDAPSTTAGSATTEPMELTASSRGVTADTIKLGVSMLDFGYLTENNFSPQGWGDQQGVYQAFFDELNTRGGINGRMIDPVYTFYNPIENTEAERACIEMTEDNEVFAVLGGFVGPAEPSNVCIPGTQSTILVGGVQDAERLAQSNAPWLFDGSLRPRRTDVFVKLLLDEGYLTESSKVAIVAGRQAESDMETVADILRDNGIDPVDVIFQDATSGDIPNEDSNWAVIAEQLEQVEADTVLGMASITSTVRGLTTNDLDVQLLVLDSGELASLGESVEPAAAEGAITINALSGDELWNHESVTECREIIAAAYPDVEFKDPSAHEEGDEQWYNSIQAYCRRVRLFELVATAAGADLTPETFLAAAEQQSQFSIPGMPFSSIAPGKTDVNDAFRLSVFDSTQGDRGLIVSLTELTDTTP
ncbi:MAG: hypothetical protein ACR2QE_20890 [Acidimicrobiales bacterium]